MFNYRRRLRGAVLIVALVVSLSGCGALSFWPAPSGSRTPVTADLTRCQPDALGTVVTAPLVSRAHSVTGAVGYCRMYEFPDGTRIAVSSPYATARGVAVDIYALNKTGADWSPASVGLGVATAPGVDLGHPLPGPPPPASIKTGTSLAWTEVWPYEGVDDEAGIRVDIRYPADAADPALSLLVTKLPLTQAQIESL